MARCQQIKFKYSSNRVCINFFQIQNFATCVFSQYQSGWSSDTEIKGQQIDLLALYIDEHVYWSNHIDHLAKKVSSGIAGLKQIRPLVPPETLGVTV